MKIGPVDVRNQTFTKKMRGVDEGEVRDYLDLVADRLEEAILEGEELRSRIDILEGEVREFRQLERSMRDSLLSAEQLVDERSAQAEKEAQIVIKNAELQADKLLARGRETLGRLSAEIDDLRRQKVTYVERFRALLGSQVKILEASLETFDPDGDPSGLREVLGTSRTAPPAAEPTRHDSPRHEPPPQEAPRHEPAPGTPAPYPGGQGLFGTRPGGGEHA